MINNHFTERAAASVRRYGHFTEVLRARATNALATNPVDENERERAVWDAHDAASSFANWEHAEINEDTQNVAITAHTQALEDLGLPARPIPDRFANFIFSAASYSARLIAVQAERDVISLGQYIRREAQRIDLYVRTGRYSAATAAAQVLIDDQQIPQFRFQDRLGRLFKSRKHIRDVYRAHLVNTYNEVYMDVLSEFGETTARVTHPDTSYAWFDKVVAIDPAAGETIPLIYDVRDEIFHPGSNATLTIDREIEYVPS